jgi:hypothetical protein
MSIAEMAVEGEAPHHASMDAADKGGISSLVDKARKADRRWDSGDKRAGGTSIGNSSRVGG